MDFNKDKSTFEDVRKAGKQLVAKRNDFIQETRYAIDLLQNKILLYMFSKVKPDDEPDTLYEFRFSELFAVMGYKTDSYTDVKRMIQRMNALSFWRDAEDEDDDDELITFFDSDSVTANQKKGYFKVRFSKKLFPYILELQKQKDNEGIYYTSYQLQSVILMKHFYSQRLYEILKSYQYNNKKWTFEIGTGSTHDIQRRLASVDPDTREAIIPEGWKNWYIFNRDVLAPAERDINNYTDIKIKYMPSKYDLQGKKHRRYVSITFAMVSKTPGEIEATDKFIDAAYQELQEAEDNKKYKQITLDDFINNQDTLLSQEASEQEEQAKMDEELKKADEMEARIAKSSHEVFTSCFGNDFNDEQLEHLYSFCCEHIETGAVEWKDRDMWATDYLSHYKKMVDATPEQTRTTAYQRLLNMVSKDYDNYAPIVTEKYSKNRYVEAETNYNMNNESMFSYGNKEILADDDPMKEMQEPAEHAQTDRDKLNFYLLQFMQEKEKK